MLWTTPILVEICLGLETTAICRPSLNPLTMEFRGVAAARGLGLWRRKGGAMPASEASSSLRTI
jgi:hypothetical protein